MKAIILNVKTGGFKKNDEVAIGKGEGKLSLDEAKALVDAGHAREIKVFEGDDAKRVKELEKALALANSDAEVKVGALTETVDRLTKALEEAEAKIAELSKK